MKTTDQFSQFTKSYWLDLDLPKFEKLQEDFSVDVAIVGAGITGITTAYLLAKEGVRTAIIEAGRALNGTTGHTTAKITAQHHIIYDELIHHFGENMAKLYYQSHTEAIEFIRKTVAEKKIDCDFSNEDAYIYSTTEKSAKQLNKEWEAYQKLNIDGEMIDQIPFDIEIKNALVMKNQAKYHPLKFLTELLKEAVQLGCLVFENTTAIDVEDDKNLPKVVTKDGYKITCNKLIVASHFPYCDKLGFYFARMYPERSYAIGIKTKKKYPGGMYISADNPIRSIRDTPLDDGSLIIIGGETHQTGQGINTMEHYQALEAFAEDVFDISEYAYRWSAQDLITLDKVPYIGPMTKEQKNILVATGFKKWGMTTGITAARMLADDCLGYDHSYKELYSPSRFTADPSLRKLISTNANVAGHFLKGKLEFIPQQPDHLKNGEGAVVMHNGKRAGAYKDENGKVYLVDTTCTHLGCETEWNDAEKTWDCPCHGSRYSYSGDVIEGPAVQPLTDLTEEID